MPNYMVHTLVRIVAQGLEDCDKVLIHVRCVLIVEYSIWTNIFTGMSSFEHTHAGFVKVYSNLRICWGYGIGT